MVIFRDTFAAAVTETARVLLQHVHDVRAATPIPVTGFAE